MVNKKVYIVFGSEDGNLGVYSTFKKAYGRAKEYLEQGERKIDRSYQSSLKDSFAIGNDTDSTTANINVFYLNQ